MSTDRLCHRCRPHRADEDLRADRRGRQPVGRGAPSCGTTQPTVSRRLQALERLLGVRLLQRSTHAMKLTEDGERCFERARELIASWQAFESDLRGADDEPEGMLRVVAPHAFGQQLLVGPLADYLRRYPRVSVEWLLHDRRAGLHRRGRRLRDPGRRSERPGRGRHQAHRGAAHRRGRALGAARARPARPRARTRARCPGSRCALSIAPKSCSRTWRSGEACRVAMRPRLSTDSLYALRSAAVMGLGVCVGSTWLLAEDLAAGRLVQLVPAVAGGRAAGPPGLSAGAASAGEARSASSRRCVFSGTMTVGPTMAWPPDRENRPDPRSRAHRHHGAALAARLAHRCAPTSSRGCATTSRPAWC